MNNRFQGEEDVGFQNELTPEEIREILAIRQKNPMQMRYDQDVQNALSKMPMYDEQDDIINKLNPQKSYDKQVEDALSKMSMRSPNDILQKLNRNPANMGESADLKQIMGMSGRPMPSATPFPQEEIGSKVLDPGFYRPDLNSKFKPEMDAGFYRPDPNNKFTPEMDPGFYPSKNKENIGLKDIQMPNKLPIESSLPNLKNILNSPANISRQDAEKLMGTTPRSLKSILNPMEQEDISAEDMEALKKILMNQGQGEMPSPTPSPMASPFRNIRGTIDRSK